MYLFFYVYINKINECTKKKEKLSSNSKKDTVYTKIRHHLEP